MKSVSTVPWEVLYKTGKKHCPPNPFYNSLLTAVSVVKKVVEKIVPVQRKECLKKSVKVSQERVKKDVPKQKRRCGSYQTNGFVCFQIQSR